jgi:hypothetical protein
MSWWRLKIRDPWTTETPELGEWYWFAKPFHTVDRRLVQHVRAEQWTEAQERTYPWQERVLFGYWQRSVRKLNPPALPEPVATIRPTP